MDVLAREQAGLDAIGRRARLHEGQRGLHRLGHHFAELAGGADLPLARSGDRLDGQQLAADLGPCETGDGADLILAVADAVTLFAAPRPFVPILPRDADPFRSISRAPGRARVCPSG